jgi:hypothetical protein
MRFNTFASKLKEAYDTVEEGNEVAYSERHKVREMISKINPKSKIFEMEVVKRQALDRYEASFQGAIDYISG